MACGPRLIPAIPMCLTNLACAVVVRLELCATGVNLSRSARHTWWPRRALVLDLFTGTSRCEGSYQRCHC